MASSAAAAAAVDPIVIVTSLGSVPAAEIINNIRQTPADNDNRPLADDLVGHQYLVRTKYYTANIQLMQYDRPLATLPVALQASIEGMLIYFDAENRDILKLIDDHLQYAKEHGLQFLVLMCDRLYDDARLGMTHREVKHCTQMFIDIVELGRQREVSDDDAATRNPTATLVNPEEEEDDDDDTTSDDHHDPIGYAELVQVLQNNIWSNVDMQALLNDNAKSMPSGEESDFRHELADFLHLSSGGSINRNDQMFADVTALLGDSLKLDGGGADATSTAEPTTTTKTVASEGTTNRSTAMPTDEREVEAELQSFEKMLQEISAFRDGAQGLSRNERFAYTSFFADALDKIVDGDADGDDEEPEESEGDGSEQTTGTSDESKP